MGYELDSLKDTLEGKGHVGLTSGNAEVSAIPGQAGAISHGGSALGVSWDKRGYNIAGAAPGESQAHSGSWPKAPSPPAMSLPPSPGPGRQGLDPGSVAVGAAGGAGAAAVGASACCCCVIL